MNPSICRGGSDFVPPAWVLTPSRQLHPNERKVLQNFRTAAITDAGVIAWREA
jgi:hypothetical protein